MIIGVLYFTLRYCSTLPDQSMLERSLPVKPVKRYNIYSPSKGYCIPQHLRKRLTSSAPAVLDYGMLL